MVNDRLPHDADAERALIGCALLSESALVDALPMVLAGDFLDVKHQHIWHAMAQLIERHERPDRVTIAAKVGELVPNAIAYMAEVENDTPYIAHVMRYARRVAALAASRRLMEAAAQITADAVNLDAADAIDRAREHIDRIEVPTVTGAPSRSFSSLDVAPYDWLIPDLLERGDRLLITGGEGSGKSTLLRQMAVQVASGISPFSLKKMQPKNVLIIDFENGERTLSRKLNWLAGYSDTLDPERLRVETRQMGVDLTSRADRHWLMDRVRANACDMLMIGPIYKMIPEADGRRDGAGGESSALRLTRVLDEIRDMGVTLVIETHAPHGNGYGRDMRPFGSSVWLRWPEFGFGLAKDEDNKRQFNWSAFRGPRDDNREWPTAMFRGIAGRWPWTATFGQANSREVA